MAIDKRELILARLFAVYQGIPGIETVVRNKGNLPEDKRPAISLFDADEEPDERAWNIPGRVAAAPNLVNLRPETYVTLNAGEENMGTVINGWRMKILKAVLLDDDLKTLVGENGAMRYEGCFTDLARERKLEGEIGLRLNFIYVLRPQQL